MIGTHPQILLQKRSEGKDSHPGCFDISSAGHIPAGVDYTDSAVRELKEELGVDIAPEKLIFCGQCYDRHESVFYGKPFIDDQVSNVYLVICPDEWETDDFCLQAEEVSEVVWMDLEECRQAVGENRIRHCIRLNELEMIREKLRELNGYYETRGGTDAEPVCGACRGHCCRTLGCMLSTGDLLRRMGRDTASKESVLALLQKESLSIDRFITPHGYFYYIRMRHKCFNFIGVDAMGECTALSEQGCTLPFELRPYGGRMLEARADRHCVTHYTRELLQEDWRPYQNILRSIWEEYEPRFDADGTFDACEEAYRTYLQNLRSAN
jgi:isopentenyldiphosphate isomerase